MPPTTTTNPRTTTGAAPCRPGFGHGDKNHCHSGPPGLAQRGGTSLIASTRAVAANGAVLALLATLIASVLLVTRRRRERA
jgi:hypothetical protein